MDNEKRWCYYVTGMHRDEAGGTEGFIPSKVTEGEPGHQLMKGDPEQMQAPWVWGPSLETAQATADSMNQRMGITKEDSAKIVASSMVASNLEGAETV